MGLAIEEPIHSRVLGIYISRHTRSMPIAAIIISYISPCEPISDLAWEASELTLESLLV